MSMPLLIIVVSSSIEESTGIGIFTPLVRFRNCLPVVAGLGNA
ncbi:hypothetical protein [Flavobacterium sp. ALD4]|nr:hypothetical protein [Flavobacterium sp. ALD4]